jgi:hypothetical protein
MDYTYIYVYMYMPCTIVNWKVFHNFCAWGKTVNRMYRVELVREELFGSYVPVNQRVFLRRFCNVSRRSDNQKFPTFFQNVKVETCALFGILYNVEL